MPVQTITVDGYAQIRDAYRCRDLRQALYDASGVVMADSLLVLHGDAHKRRRRIENRLFRRGVFREWERTIVRRTVAEALAPCRATGRAELVELGYRAISTLTATVAGVDVDIDAGDTLWRFARTFSEGATLAHTTRDPAVVRAEVGAALEEFTTLFVVPSAARRRDLLERFHAGTVADDDLPRDVLTALLRHRDELGLDDATIRRECAFYLQAGSHSSVDALVHAVDDLFAWTTRDPVRAARAWTDRAFLQRCVHESLRLHPASPVARRHAVADVVLRDGTVVPAGTDLVMDVAAANRDPSVFADPDVYDPDRTVPPGVARWGHAFGGGMHACIGTELAAGVPGPDAVLGTVTTMLAALLDAGVRPDPSEPPRRDPRSARDHFGRYPVVFDGG
ncbi:cytochrome P450 [Pseudonocardia endophytica]|uniref:Cytochrome P450 n=1 Tax=Pseudonocardia endophytica TaxID=401976 RepID=A0A4V6NDJ6_PSEEN|nr:cytochrome P450 [Pseudonocardia endophytica]TCK26386.1 cytochrome P450 [Pseudonocardia endophytica]